MEQEVYTYQYPHPAVTTDCVVFGFDNKDLNVLLIRRGIPPFKDRWAFPGGFIRMDETAEECVRRELEEETGLAPKYVEQFYTFSEVNRDPRERVITIAFFTLVNNSDVLGGDDAAEAQWFKVNDLPELAFDHYEIFKKAKKALQHQVHFEPICFEMMDECFSMPNLQRLYEAILETSFDRRNFQKKILQLGILTEVDQEMLPEEPLCATDVSSLPEEYTPEFLNASYFAVAQLCFEKSISFSSHKHAAAAESVEIRESKAMTWTNGLNITSRKSKKYKFNKEQYEAMKSRKPFRLEF